MRCEQCGRDFAAGLGQCPHCGAAVHYGGNTVFFDKAAQSKLTVADLFNGVFARHPKGSGAKMFMAGTPLTTPTPDRMLAEWQKPWLFLRVLAVGLVFGVLCYVLASMGYGAGVYSLFSLCALIVPISILIFFWEVNIPRDIPLYTVLVVFLLGGILSLIFPDFLGQRNIDGTTAYLAAFTEEPAKVIATAIFIYLLDTKYIFGGVLVGAAVGTGFACMENISYVMDGAFSGYGVQLLVSRSILAIGGHILWAGIEGGALCMAKGSGRLSFKDFIDKNFLIYLASTVAMHALWNSDIFLAEIPVFLDLKYLLLCAAAVLVMFTVLKRAVSQVLTAADSAHVRSQIQQQAFIQNQQQAVPASLYMTAGPMAGMAFPLEGPITIGRSKGCNLILPDDTRGVSRRHCAVERRADGVYLMDLNSSVGTFWASGQRIPANQWVKVTGPFYLGSPKISFTVQ